MDPRLETCLHCMNKKFDLKRGVVCNLTDAKPDWDFSCDKYDRNDGLYRNHLIQKEKENKLEAESATLGFSQVGIKSGIVAGMIVMVLSIVWLLVGLSFNWIFYYPFILFIFGAIAFVRGIIKRKKRKAKTKSSVEILDAPIID